MSTPEPTAYPLPTLTQVAALLRARTVDGSTNGYGIDTEAATFTAATRPTASAVTDLIALTRPRVEAVTGTAVSPCATRYAGLATLAHTYLVCADIEASYFPRQTSGDQTATEYFAGRADALLAELRTQIDECVADGDDSPGSRAGGAPVGAFPPSRLAGRIL